MDSDLKQSCGEPPQKRLDGRQFHLGDVRTALADIGAVRHLRRISNHPIFRLVATTERRSHQSSRCTTAVAMTVFQIGQMASPLNWYVLSGARGGKLKMRGGHRDVKRHSAVGL